MLTDLAIKTAIKSSEVGKPAVVLRDVGERGGGRLSLSIRRSNETVISEWYVTWYRGGERKTTKMGGYPSLGLREARKLFRERYLPEIQDGKDPTGPRAFRRMPGMTVADLFEAYVEHLETEQRRSAGDVRRILLGPTGAINDIGRAHLANDIQPKHLIPHLSKIHARGSVGQANLVRGYLSAAFAFGLKSPHAYVGSNAGKDWGLTYNPAALIQVDKDAFQARTRTLSRSEFAAFWWWLTDRAVYNKMAVALQLMMLTGQRPDEVMQISTEVFERDGMRLFWPKTKNKYHHSIPVTGLAREALEALPPNEFGLYFWRPAQPAQRAAVGAPRRLVHEYIAATGCKPFTCHDLRRTWKTLAGDAQIHRDVRDLLQNHRKRDVSARHYDHYDYRREKLDGMQTWDAYVVALLTEYPRQVVGEVYEFGGFRFDTGNLELRSAAGRRHLPAAEGAVLAVLLAADGAELSRGALAAACYGDEEPTFRAVDLRISRLRRVLGPCGRQIVQTCRGTGYRLPGAMKVAADESDCA